MAKGVSIKFKSYFETVPKLLELIKLERELEKHDKIVLKPHLGDENNSTPAAFVEAVLKFCLAHKKEGADIFIAEGADGSDTMELFEQRGYKKIAEDYSIGLIDLNSAETEEILDGNFIKFENIMYPKILLDSFVISLPKSSESSEYDLLGALSIMIGAYPARYYSSFFSSKKNKIKKWPQKYSIHDILLCKMPEFAIADASDKGVIMAGVPLEIDKQAAKLLGRDWKSIGYLRLINESYGEEGPKKREAKEIAEVEKEEDSGKKEEEIKQE